MAFSAPTESMPGKIREVTIGSGDKSVTVGGETALPFHGFEGEIPNRPAIAIEIQDIEPSDWPETLTKQYGDSVADPAEWAKKATEFGADMVALYLAGADPNNGDKSPDEVGKVVQAVADATDLPIIVLGCGNADKDAEVLKKAAEVGQDKRIVVGPATQDNYKSVAGSALGYRQNVIGTTPIDVNLAKQLNILLGNLGLPDDMILMDPSTGGQSLGYGLEYSYSVMERDRLAALQSNDEVMQVPLICNVAREVWKAKEVKTTEADAPEWGDQDKRGILWEAITALSMLVAGANVLIMRHPESIKLVKSAIDELY